MDDAFSRSRYQKSVAYARRRKKTVDKSKKSTGEILIRQTAICIIILLTILVTKNIDKPFTNNIMETIKGTLLVDMEAEGIFKGINDTIKGGTDISNEISAVSAGIFESGKTSDNTVSIEDDVLKKMILPVNGTVRMPFGEFIHPVVGISVFHTGIDIGVRNNTKINAVYEGIVAETGSKPEYGNYIIINHGSEIQTVYAHCSEITVKPEQEIKQGQIIGEIKNTSAHTGLHLHFEIVVNNNPVDPLKYISVE
jgi:murein DD-endopeptidase MepM/ murein hydrolase activator NlpD